MTNRDVICGFKNTIRNFKEEEDRKLKNKEGMNLGRGSGLVTNFIKLQDSTKVYCLDVILSTAKDVYGPYGGIYAKFERAMQSNDSNVIKSKDGNGFFKEVLLYPDFGNTILHLMRQKTDYISSLKADTSKDGTTSMAVVSAAISKMLLMNRVLSNFVSPSTVLNILFDVALSEGSKIIDKYKQLTYDDNKGEFLPGGEETVLNTINTTVNNNPIFYQAYKGLLEQAKQSGSNILDMEFEVAPLYREGEPNVELKLFEGVSMVLKDLNKMNSKAYTANNQLLFIFDGFAELNFISDVYLRKLYSFLNKDVFEIADKVGAEGVVVIFNRTPENLIEALRHYNESGFIKCPNVKGINRDLVGRTLKFRAMVFDDTATGRERFEDMLEVFSESTISVTNLNDTVKKYIATNYLSDDMIDMSNIKDPHLANKAKISAETIKEAFGSNKPLSRFVVLPDTYKPFEYLFGKLEMNDEGKYVWRKLNAKGELEDNNIENLVLNTKFNSYDLHLTFRNKEVNNRAIKIKSKLQDILHSVESSNTNTDDLEFRIRCLTSNRLQPIIYTRTADEREELFNLLLDSQGVFISTMSHGVHGGGNTCILKHEEEFKENCLKAIKEALKDKVSEDKLEKYINHMNILTNCIIEGYKIAYKFILREETDEFFEEVLNKYRNDYRDETTTTYNVITGKYSDKIVEAARTTADVFSCSLAIAKDMLLIDRCNITYGSISEFNTIESFNRSHFVHEINDFLLEERK